MMGMMDALALPLPVRLLLLFAVAFAAAASGVLEVPRIIVGFLLGCWTCILWQPDAMRAFALQVRAPACKAKAADTGAVAEADVANAPHPAADNAAAVAGATAAPPVAAAAAAPRAAECILQPNAQEPWAPPTTPQAQKPRAPCATPRVAGCPADGRSESGQRPRACALCAQAAGHGLSLPEGCRMLVLNGVPRKCTQQELASRLQGIGYRDDVNLVHLPLSLKTARHLGYALVGFRTAAACAQFAKEFHLTSSQVLLPDIASRGALEVAPSPCKGRSEYIKKLRAVPGMEERAKLTPDLLPLLLD